MINKSLEEKEKEKEKEKENRQRDLSKNTQIKK